MRSKRAHGAVQAGDPFLDPFLARYAQEINKLSRATAEHICHIGKLLVAARERMPHGSWLPWLEKEFAWSSDMAERFINVYKRFSDPKFRRMRNMAGATLLVELAKPSMPEVVRAEIIDRVERGERVKVGDVRKTLKRTARNVPVETKSLPVTVEHEVVAAPIYRQPKEERVHPVYQEPVETVARQLPPPMDAQRTSTADADIILHQLHHLSLTVRNSVVARVVERAPDRDELVEQVDVVSEFLSLLKEAAVGSKPPIPARPPEMPPGDNDPPVSTEPESKTKH
jgi:hypothetical protein